MRKLVLCLGLGVAALASADVATLFMMDLAIAGANARDNIAHAIAVDRRGKGDARERDIFPALEEHKIATVEVIGLERAAIVYRSRDGRVLFHTDPVSNTTVVVRGVTLPEVTVRETTRKAPDPVIMRPETQPEPAADEQDEQDEKDVRKPKQKLPEGCEPAGSALSASGTSSIGARCIADLIPAARFASVL